MVQREGAQREGRRARGRGYGRRDSHRELPGGGGPPAGASGARRHLLPVALHGVGGDGHDGGGLVGPGPASDGLRRLPTRARRRRLPGAHGPPPPPRPHSPGPRRRLRPRGVVPSIEAVPARPPARPTARPSQAVSLPSRRIPNARPWIAAALDAALAAAHPQRALKCCGPIHGRTPRATLLLEWLRLLRPRLRPSLRPLLRPLPAAPLAPPLPPTGGAGAHSLAAGESRWGPL